MSGICHIRPVSVGLESRIWYLFIYIAGYLNVRKISETMGFRTFVVPLHIKIVKWNLQSPGGGSPHFMSKILPLAFGAPQKYQPSISSHSTYCSFVRERSQIWLSLLLG